MVQKILYSLLILIGSAILYMLPVSDGVHDFRTDIREDSYFIETDGSTVTCNVTLQKPVYDGDTTTISFSSDTPSDAPELVNYTSTNRLVDLTGLTISSNRTLIVSYPVDALNSSAALNGFMDKVPWIWMICVICFAPAALAAMWIRK